MRSSQLGQCVAYPRTSTSLYVLQRQRCCEHFRPLTGCGHTISRGLFGNVTCDCIDEDVVSTSTPPSPKGGTTEHDLQNRFRNSMYMCTQFALSFDESAQ